MNSALVDEEPQVPVALVEEQPLSGKPKTMIWWWLGMGIIFLSIVFGLYLFFFREQIISPLSAGPSIPTPTPDPLRPRTILLLGYGGGKHEGGALTDTIIAAHIIPKEKRMVLISIPRDLWISLPLSSSGMSSYKINTAYAFGSDTTQFPDRPKEFKGARGGGNLASFAAATVLGVSVEYFAAVSFTGFTKLVDSLGGLDIEVPYTFEDPYYPLEEKTTDPCSKSEDDIKKTMATLSGFLLEKEFPCRYEKISFQKGKTHMDGKTALQFVRSRHSDVNGGDFGRSQRQLALMKAVKSKFLSFGTIPKIIPVVKNLFGMLDTNITLGDVTQFVEQFSDITSYAISSLSLTEDNVFEASTSAAGQYILVPRKPAGSFDGVSAYIDEQLYPATPAGTLKGNSQ